MNLPYERKSQMMKMSVLVFVLVMLVSCSKGSESPEEETLPLNPTAPTLIYPNNNEPCLDAISLNDSQSQIAFNWNQSDNTDNYTLIITNLSTNDTQEILVSFPPIIQSKRKQTNKEIGAAFKCSANFILYSWSTYFSLSLLLLAHYSQQHKRTQPI